MLTGNLEMGREFEEHFTRDAEVYGKKIFNTIKSRNLTREQIRLFGDQDVQKSSQE